LRSVSGDAAYVASVVNQVTGPVPLVGHSYGGVVIGNAAAQATDSLLGPALRPAQYSTGGDAPPGTELYIDTASFHEVFAADLPAETAAVMAVSQRSGDANGFGEKTQAAAWKTLPSWAIIGTADKAVGITGLRVMAERAGSDTTEIDASHVLMISQPTAVADVIRTALASLA
jgi:pimeloyl-ACP methyl ester carboxylesterase